MVNGTAESLCQHGACGGGIRGPDSLLLPPIGTLLAETGQGFMSWTICALELLHNGRRTSRLVQARCGPRRLSNRIFTITMEVRIVTSSTSCSCWSLCHP
jgi:hypothetical protein